MRSVRWLSLSLLLLAMAARAEDKNPADYPLRIHIFRRAETTFYYHRMEEEAKGEGRANLFENGEPKGLDFQFECSEKLQTSSGFETFPARWKKPNEELVILQPEFGKANSYNTCHLKVMVKDFAYYSRSGNLNTEPITQFKAWMVKHDYDPEHGKTTPMTAPQNGAGTPAAAPVGSGAAGSGAAGSGAAGSGAAGSGATGSATPPGPQ